MFAVIKMWYKNFAGRFICISHKAVKHARDKRMDRRADRIMTPKTVLA